jgi:hypothetical protein
MTMPETGIAPALMNGVKEEARNTVEQAIPSRRKRSDAGKPRPFSASLTLGVKFDLATDEGRALLTATLGFWISQGKREQVEQVAAQLLRELDRLNKKHAQ